MPSDAELIRASRSDPEAFTCVFERHFAPVHRYLARRAGADAADELAAETFTVAYARRRDYDLARDDAAPWLFGIATNLLRRRRRDEERALRAYALTGDDPLDATPRAGALSAELAGALAELAAGDREVLLLVAWADLRYEDVARALGIPVGTVRSRLFRARRTLRLALAETEAEDRPAATRVEVRHG